MTNFQDYVDESISFDLDAVLALQGRAAYTSATARTWHDLSGDDYAITAQNEAMGMYAHARIALARYDHQAPDHHDQYLTVICWARADVLLAKRHT